MRRLMLLWLSAAVLGTGLLAGLWGRPSVCVGCDPTERFILIQACEWDWGCFLNPFEPDGQWWCEFAQVYECPGKCTLPTRVDILGVWSLLRSKQSWSSADTRTCTCSSSCPYAFRFLVERGAGGVFAPCAITLQMHDLVLTELQ